VTSLDLEIVECAQQWRRDVPVAIKEYGYMPVWWVSVWRTRLPGDMTGDRKADIIGIWDKVSYNLGNGELGPI
jgi:hypothetical protein